MFGKVSGNFYYIEVYKYRIVFSKNNFYLFFTAKVCLNPFETADGFGVCCCFDGLLGVLLTIRLVVIKIHCNKYMSR